MNETHVVVTRTEFSSVNKNKFSIDARSCTLLGATDDVKSNTALLEGQKYIIPVYQRPYSWDKEQVMRLLKGIVGSYQNDQESYFIGTMQLMPKVDESGSSFYEVVDGQQRLTTLLLFFKVIQLQFGEGALPTKLQSLDWLQTKVSKHEHQKMMLRVLNLTQIPQAVENEESLNPYLRNLQVLHKGVLELESKEDDKPFEINSDFINYLTSQLYVVVIETRAGLAKTLDIFNTINTAGMDLNGGDVFKVQLFEYLTRICHHEDSVFDEIDDLYASVEKTRQEFGNVTWIGLILETYKYILIERVGASRTLHELGTDTFFERLFSCILMGEKPLNFNYEKMLEALGSNPLVDLKRLVDVNYQLEKRISQNHRTWRKLHEKTRYGRYWVLDNVYLFRFYTDDSFSFGHLEDWKEKLVKYHMVKTIQYKRRVNHAKTFTYDTIRFILIESTSQDSTVEFVNQKLNGYANESFTNELSCNLYDNATQRYLVFWVLAMLEEPDWDNKETYEKFFNSEINKYDIEHIRPRRPEKSTNVEDLAWTNHINTIGNLVLLERDLNRSGQVKHYGFEHKHTYGYSKSKLKKIEQLREEHQDLIWDIETCQNRAFKEIQKLTEFLFGFSLN